MDRRYINIFIIIIIMLTFQFFVDIELCFQLRRLNCFKQNSSRNQINLVLPAMIVQLRSTTYFRYGPSVGLSVTSGEFPSASPWDLCASLDAFPLSCYISPCAFCVLPFFGFSQWLIKYFLCVSSHAHGIGIVITFPVRSQFVCHIFLRFFLTLP